MKTIIIGLGPHGQRVLSAVMASDKLKLIGVVDLSSEVLVSLNVPTELKHSDLDLVLSKMEVDLACITTNGPSHAALAIKCMESGVKHIMVEKPMACSLQECFDMQQVAQEMGVRLAVDHPRRFSKNYGLVRQLAEENQLGEFRSIYIQRPGIGLGCLATHSFDLANFISAMKPRRIVAWVDDPKKINPRGGQFVDPGGTVIMEYGSGKRAIVTQIEDGAGPIFVEVNYTAGRVHIDEKGDRLEIIKRDLSVTKKPGQGAVYKTTLNPNGIGGKRVLTDEIRWLLEDLVTKDKPSSNAQHGFDSIEVLVAAYLSEELGNAPIELPIDKKHYSKWLPIT